MDKIKQWFTKTFLLNTVIKNVIEILDWIGEKLGPNGAKTFYGLVALVLAMAKMALPQYAIYIDPIYEQLGIDDQAMIAAAALYTLFVGLAHKPIKALNGIIKDAESE